MNLFLGCGGVVGAYLEHPDAVARNSTSKEANAIRFWQSFRIIAILRKAFKFA